MSLKRQAIADHQAICENTGDFAWPVFLVSPEKMKKEVSGLTNDISDIIDPDTGTPISGRLISIHLSQQTIFSAGFKQLPYSIADESKKPWLVELKNPITDIVSVFKVKRSLPDTSLGGIKLILELYSGGC